MAELVPRIKTSRVIDSHILVIDNGIKVAYVPLERIAHITHYNYPSIGRICGQLQIFGWEGTIISEMSDIDYEIGEEAVALWAKYRKEKK